MKILPYVYLNERAEEAINFYKEVFGDSELIALHRYSEAEGFPVAEADKNKVMHAQLKIHGSLIYFSDTLGEDKLSNGNVTILVEFDDVTKIEQVYADLSKGGEVKMKLEDTFWGAKYAKIVDKFGLAWDLNCELPPK